MYLIMFLVGAGFVAISFLLGEMVELEGARFGVLQPKLIAVFLTVMGGLGLLLTPVFGDANWVSAAIVLNISAVAGFVVAGGIHRFVIVPLQKAQNTSAFNMQDTIGAPAEVISRIPRGGYGKIRYNISGSYVTAPAKDESGYEIRRGEKVVISYIEKNTYYVRPDRSN